MGSTKQFYPDRYYEQFLKGHYATSVVEAVKLLPDTVDTVLDVGCETGACGQLFKQLKNVHVTGIEFNSHAVQQAQIKLDRVFEMDLQEAFELPISAASFDCMILLDVIEHVLNPKQTVAQLLKYLHPDGYVIFSIPNIRWQGAMVNLIYNAWWGDNQGVIVDEHLRFFTLNTIGEFLQYFGLHFDSPVSCVGTPLLPEMEPLLDLLESKGQSRLRHQLEFQTFQYVFRATLKKFDVNTNMNYIPNRLDWTIPEIKNYLKK